MLINYLDDIKSGGMVNILDVKKLGCKIILRSENDSFKLR